MKTFLTTHKTIIFFSLIIGLIFNQGCVNKNALESSDVGIEIKSEEVSFDSVKTDISKISYLLGVNKYTKSRQSQPDEMTLVVGGKNNIINGEIINLNNSKIVFKKITALSYTLNTYFKDWGVTASLSVDNATNSFIMKLNNVSFNLQKNLDMTSRQRLVAIILLNYYDEFRVSNPYLVNGSTIRNENESPIGKSIYSFTIGWGFTREQSIDDELSARGGSVDEIKKYECTLLGTSTSCFFESLGCVTISTFKCNIAS